MFRTFSNWLASKYREEERIHRTRTVVPLVSIMRPRLWKKEKELDSLDSIVFSFLSISIFPTASEYHSLPTYKKSFHFISLKRDIKHSFL